MIPESPHLTRVSLAIALVAICAGGCSSGRTIQPTLPTIAANDLPLYRPVLGYLAEQMKKHHPSALLLVDQTTRGGMCDSAGAVGYRRKDPTIMTLEVASSLRNRDHFHLPLVAESPLRMVTSGEGPTWRQLGRKLRRFDNVAVYGVAHLSAPGYNWDGDVAMIEVGVSCGYLCGYGQLLVLEKKADEWHIREVIDTWVS